MSGTIAKYAKTFAGVVAAVGEKRGWKLGKPESDPGGCAVPFDAGGQRYEAYMDRHVDSRLRNHPIEEVWFGVRSDGGGSSKQHMNTYMAATHGGSLGTGSSDHNEVTVFREVRKRLEACAAKLAPAQTPAQRVAETRARLGRIDEDVGVVLPLLMALAAAIQLWHERSPDRAKKRELRKLYRRIDGPIGTCGQPTEDAVAAAEELKLKFPELYASAEASMPKRRQPQQVQQDSGGERPQVAESVWGPGGSHIVDVLDSIYDRIAKNPRWSDELDAAHDADLEHYRLLAKGDPHGAPEAIDYVIASAERAAGKLPAPDVVGRAK